MHILDTIVKVVSRQVAQVRELEQDLQTGMQGRQLEPCK